MPLYWVRARCRHRCDCGAILICNIDPDRCTVERHWLCDNCVGDQFDAYISRLQAQEKDALCRLS